MRDSIGLGDQIKSNLSKRDKKMQAALSPKEFKKYMKQKQKSSRDRDKWNNSTAVQQQKYRAQNLTAYLKQCQDSYKKIQQELDFTYTNLCHVTLNGVSMLIWLSDNKLKMVEKYPPNFELENRFNTQQPLPKWRYNIIPIASIQYFSCEGEVYTETKISGGGNTGPNIGGAIIGGIIAGGVGAIIGGQSKIEPIKSELIKHDERKTVLAHINGKLEFAYKDYPVFVKLIPDKELPAPSKYNP